MYNMNQRVAVVTGAAQGIGAAIVKRLLEENAYVAMLDLKIQQLEELQNSIDSAKERTLAVECNVADKDSVENAFKLIEDRFGKVDILVNNAGITRDMMAHKMDLDSFDKVVRVSLYGTFLCTSQVISGMKERNYGRIISLSSLSSRGNIGQANYSSAKAGIIGYTKTLSLELGKNGITVNCIAPGLIRTDMISTIPEKVLNETLKGIPLRRAGEPEEVAALVAFLASDEASYISGQCIRISGGLG